MKLGQSIHAWQSGACGAEDLLTAATQASSASEARGEWVAWLEASSRPAFLTALSEEQRGEWAATNRSSSLPQLSTKFPAGKILPCPGT